MTNEEAIELLKNMHWSITTKMNRGVPSSLALLMAIEALKQHPTFDWLMQKADEWGMAYGKQFLIEAQRAWKNGKDTNVPTKWIPVQRLRKEM